MTDALEYLYNLLCEWPDRPAELKIGQPKGGSGYFIEPLASAQDGGYSRLFDICMRLRPDGNTDMLACAALCDSLCEYACSGGDADMTVSLERSVSMSALHSDGSRDFTLRLRCDYSDESAISTLDPSPILRFVINGRSVTIGGGSCYGLVSVKGLESADYFTSITPNGAQDGSFVRGLYSPKRTIALALSFPIDELTETRREYLISILAPDATGTLSVQRGGLHRKITAVIDDVSYTRDPIARIVTVNITLICPDPYFYDAEPHIYTINSSIPLLTMPFNSMAGVGITASVIRTDYNVTIINTGHTDAGFTAEIYSPSGGLTNPSLTMGTNFIKILDLSSVGDRYTVSSGQNVKYIKKNGVNFYAFDRRSVFFTLKKGENTIMVGAESGENAIEADISVEFRYFGI